MLTRLFPIFLLSCSLFVSPNALAANTEGAVATPEEKAGEDKIKTLVVRIEARRKVRHLNSALEDINMLKDEVSEIKSLLRELVKNASNTSR